MKLRHEPRRAQAARETAAEEEYDAHGGQDEEQRHLDAQTPAVEYRARRPEAFLEEVDGEPEEEGREAVVEAPEDEDAVEALGEDQEREDVGRDLRRRC